ncbi:MAG: hypothetical protein HDR51_01430 [Treponema sp.]|nr:hypothetical protein [Treponema sp.]MDE6244760.1 hypothetical protein [Treponemataceae bacterium]MBD5404256.1 hypothetical protein [Treponema sp.]MBD5406647.1 hypothetical protein [Treponema sp.]MBD5408716.1 hypothetical protein [Treponema sp.]
MKCIEMLRQLVSDVQGAPYPGKDINDELYTIWYEHVQEVAVACFQFLNENFPQEARDVNKKIDSLFN